MLLPVEITPSADEKAGSNLRLGATLKWLVCREICIPGHADLELALPVARDPSASPPIASLFAKARAHLPRPAPGSWKIHATLDEHRFELTVLTGKPEERGGFFPLEPNQIDNAAAPKAIPLDRGLKIEMPKSDQLLKAPPRLKGVLVLAGERGYVIEAAVTTGK